LQVLLKSTKLFARKFDPASDTAIMDKLDEYMVEKPVLNVVPRVATSA
jgi:hypothetical protein